MILGEQFVSELRAEGFDVRADYSGRWMFGSACLGVVGSRSDLVRFVYFVAQWGAENGEDMTWIFDVHDDSMGLSTVFYWPNVEVEKER